MLNSLRLGLLSGVECQFSPWLGLDRSGPYHLLCLSFEPLSLQLMADLGSGETGSLLLSVSIQALQPN